MEPKEDRPMTQGIEVPEEGRELYATADAIGQALRPIMGPLYKRIVATVILAEVDVVEDVPSPGLHSFSFGAHCVLGNVPEDALPTFLRHVAECEETGRPVLVKRTDLRAGSAS